MLFFFFLKLGTLLAEEENNFVTLDFILNKYYEFQTNPKKLESIKSLRIKGIITFSNNLKANFILIKKRPNKVRLTLIYPNNKKYTQSYNGETGWKRTPNDALEKLSLFESKSISRDALLFNYLLTENDDYTTKLSFLGEASVRTIPCYRIQVKLNDSEDRIEYYLNKTHFNEEKISIVEDLGFNQVRYVDSLLSDYREVPPLKQAFKIETFIEGKKTSTLQIEEILYNIGVLDIYFDPPSGVNQELKAG